MVSIWDWMFDDLLLDSFIFDGFDGFAWVCMTPFLDVILLYLFFCSQLAIDMTDGLDSKPWQPFIEYIFPTISVVSSLLFLPALVSPVSLQTGSYHLRLHFTLYRGPGLGTTLF